MRNDAFVPIIAKIAVTHFSHKVDTCGFANQQLLKKPFEVVEVH
jgi:hypothetical protein